jgi:hypothetical protein
MKKRIEKIILLKDMPGADKGSEISLYEVNVKNGEGSCLRGATIGKKFYWDSQFVEYPDFFRVVIETSK